jgi:hypothetical protein
MTSSVVSTSVATPARLAPPAWHGKARTHDDKRRIVTRMLQDEEWMQWSDREIARHCGGDHKSVAKRRRELSPSGEIPQMPRTVQRNGTVYTMDTSAIRHAPPFHLLAEYSRALPYMALVIHLATIARHCGVSHVFVGKQRQELWASCNDYKIAHTTRSLKETQGAVSIW